MSRLLVNSVANFGKLMRNVGTKNYSTECGPALWCPLNAFINHLDYEASRLDSIHDFDVVGVNKETDVVKLVKDLPNMKMKIMFNMNMNTPYMGFDKKKSSSTLKFLEERIKQKGLRDVNFHSENDESLMKKMVEDDTIVVELDKGQSKNLVAVYQSVSQYDHSKIDFVLNDFNLMSKEDKCLEPSSFDDTIKDHIEEVLKELGMKYFGGCFDMWGIHLGYAEIEKYSEMKNFFMA